MNTLAPLIAYQKAKQDELVKQNCIVNRLLLTAELTDQQFQKLREAQNVRNSITETHSKMELIKALENMDGECLGYILNYSYIYVYIFFNNYNGY